MMILERLPSSEDPSMRIPIINIEIDPRTPEGKALIGSAIRWIVGAGVSVGLYKFADAGDIDKIVAGALAVVALIASLKSSQQGDTKVIDKKADAIMDVVADHVGEAKASTIANDVAVKVIDPDNTKPK